MQFKSPRNPRPINGGYEDKTLNGVLWLELQQYVPRDRLPRNFILISFDLLPHVTVVMFQFLEKSMATKGYDHVRPDDVPSIADDDFHDRRDGSKEIVRRVKPLAFGLFVLISVGANFIFLIKSGQQLDIGRSPFSKS